MLNSIGADVSSHDISGLGYRRGLRVACAGKIKRCHDSIACDWRSQRKSGLGLSERQCSHGYTETKHDKGARFHRYFPFLELQFVA
jgi:hypothetical protein